VPFVMLWVDGKPDFRAVDSEKIMECYKSKLCGICGRRLGEFSYFIGGDGCKRNHVFLDPAMHRECAEFSAIVCPFLSGQREGYSERPIPKKNDIVIATRPAWVPENKYILKSRTKWTEMRPEAGGGVAFKAGMWLGAVSIRPSPTANSAIANVKT